MSSKRERELFYNLNDLESRLAEDELYAFVEQELSNNDLDPVAKMRAFEEAEGDENVAKALYTTHRIRRLKDLAAEEMAWQAKAEAAAQQADRERRAQESAEAEQARREQEKRNVFQAHKRQLERGELPAAFKRVFADEFRTFKRSWEAEEPHRKSFTNKEKWKVFMKHVLETRGD